MYQALSAYTCMYFTFWSGEAGEQGYGVPHPALRSAFLSHWPHLYVCIACARLTLDLCMHIYCTSHTYLSGFILEVVAETWVVCLPSTYPASLHVTNSSRPSLFIVAYGKWSKIKLFLHSRVLVHVRATKTYFYYYSLCFSMFQHKTSYTDLYDRLPKVVGCKLARLYM